MEKDFKFNEIIRFYFVAKELGLTPTIILSKYNHEKWIFEYIQVQIRNIRMYSRIYDSKYLEPRIKKFLEIEHVKKNLIKKNLIIKKGA